MLVGISGYVEIHPLIHILLDYELGRLLACMGKREEARSHLDLVFSGMSVHQIVLGNPYLFYYKGKALEVSSANRKGKYSLENSLNMRTHAALSALDQGRQL